MGIRGWRCWRRRTGGEGREGLEIGRNMIKRRARRTKEEEGKTGQGGGRAGKWKGRRRRRGGRKDWSQDKEGNSMRNEEVIGGRAGRKGYKKGKNVRKGRRVKEMEEKKRRKQGRGGEGGRDGEERGGGVDGGGKAEEIKKREYDGK